MSKNKNKNDHGRNEPPAVRKQLAILAEALRDIRQRDVTGMLRGGELLVEAKTKCANSGASFKHWLESEFAWTERTAQRWMVAAKWHHNLSEKKRLCVVSSFESAAIVLLARLDKNGEGDVKAVARVLDFAALQGSGRRIGATQARAIIGGSNGKKATTANPIARGAALIANADSDGPLDGLEAEEIARASLILEKIHNRLKSAAASDRVIVSTTTFDVPAGAVTERHAQYAAETLKRKIQWLANRKKRGGRS